MNDEEEVEDQVAEEKSKECESNAPREEQKEEVDDGTVQRCSSDTDAPRILDSPQTPTSSISSRRTVNLPGVAWQPTRVGSGSRDDSKSSGTPTDGDGSSRTSTLHCDRQRSFSASSSRQPSLPASALEFTDTNPPEESGFLPLRGAESRSLSFRAKHTSLTSSGLGPQALFANRSRKQSQRSSRVIKKNSLKNSITRARSLSAAVSPKSANEVTNFLLDKAVVKSSKASESETVKPYIKKLTSLRLDDCGDGDNSTDSGQSSFGLRRRIVPIKDEDDESSYSEINKQLAFHKSRVIKKTPASYGEHVKLSKEQREALEEKRLSTYMLMAEESKSIVSEEPRQSSMYEQFTRVSISLGRSMSLRQSGSMLSLSSSRSNKIVPMKTISGSSRSTHLSNANELAREHIPEEVPRWMVLPDNKYKLVWDMNMLVIVVYYIVTVPLIICFGGTEPSLLEEDPTLDFVLFLVFVADMISNCFIALENTEGTAGYIYDRKTIIKAYLKGWFVIDLVATFPISLLVSSTETDQSSLGDLNKILRLLRIFKLFRILRLARLLPRLEATTFLNPAILRLIKLFTSSLFLWHWIACGYWFVAESEDYGKDGPIWVREGSNGWLPSPKIWCRDLAECNETAHEFMWDKVGFNPYTDLEDCFNRGECPATFSKKYLHSFFWALMATVGVGDDIKPITLTEHLFSVVIIIIGIFMIASMISSASSALASLESAEMERRTRLHKIRAYLRKIAIKGDLRQRILEYYEFAMTTRQNKPYGSNQKHLSDLHHLLRMDLDVALHRHLVEKVPMLRALGQSSCLLKLIPKFKRITFIPGEYLVIQGEACNEMHIIVSGAVKVIQTEAGVSKIIATLHDGESFGEIGLLFRQKQACSVRASNYTDVLVLTKHHFDQVMENFPELYSTVVRAAGFQLGKHGWNRVREALKVARVCSMFGRGMKLHELLLGNEDTETQDNGLKQRSWRRMRGSIPRLGTFTKGVEGKHWRKLKNAVKITQAMAMTKKRD